MSLFGAIGTGIKSAAQTAVGASPYVAQMLAEKDAREKADQARLLSQMHTTKQDTIAQQNADTAAAGEKARAAAAEQGSWSNPFSATDENGNPILVQQHKQTGELRRATLPELGGAPGGAPGGPPTKAAPDPFAIKPWRIGNIDVPAGGAQALSTPMPVSSSPPMPMASGTLRPFVKPPVSTKQPSEIPGTPEWLKAQDDLATIRDKHRAAPQPTFTPFQGTGSDGKPVVRPFNTKTGSFGPVADVAPKATTAGGGGSLSPEDRQKLLNQARLDNETMKAYENKLMAAGKTVGMGAGLAGASAEAHGSPLNNAIGIIGNKATGSIDPDYQRYITAQRSYGRVMGNLQSKRYTDNQAEIERSIGGMQGADLASTIKYKQQLRDASLADDGPTQAQAPMSGRGGAPPNVAHPANKNDVPGGLTFSTGNALKPISDVDRAHAQHDPGFAKWLKDNGYEAP